INPGADAVVAQIGALAVEGIDQFAEDFVGLRGRRAGYFVVVGAEARAPQMAASVFLDQQVLGRKTAPEERLAAVDVISEQRQFRAGQRRLLHDGGGDRIVGRIEREAAIAYER